MAPVAPDWDARFMLLLVDNRLVAASETLTLVYDISSNKAKLICEI